MDTNYKASPNRFLVRPKPEDDEHPLSFLIRLGEANGYTGRDALYAFLARSKRCLQSRSGLENLAHLADLEVHELENVVRRAQWIPGNVQRLSQFVRRCFFRNPHIAFCPVCLRERGSFRAVWNFRAVAACEVHGLWLVDRCPRCSDHIRWKRDGIVTCGCGLDLREVIEDKAPTEVALITKVLTGALVDTMEDDLLTSGPFSHELDTMTALEWLALFNFLASTSQYSSNLHPFGENPLKAEKDAVSIAARIFLSWPESAFEELSTCWRSTVSRLDQSPVISSTQLRARHPFRRVRRFAGPTRLPKFMSRALDKCLKTLTISSDGGGLTINPDWLVFLPGEMPGVRQSASDDASHPDTQSHSTCTITRLPQMMRQFRRANIVFYNYRLARKLVGATPHQSVLLKRCGFLLPTPTERRISSSEVDRLGRWLRRLAAPMPRDGQLVALSALSRDGGTLLQRVIEAIQSGTIQLFCSRTFSIKLEVCFVDVRSICRFPR